MSSVSRPRLQASSASRNHDVPGCSVLTQMLAAAARCSALREAGYSSKNSCGSDDEIDRTVGSGKTIVDQLDLAAGQRRGLGDPTGDVVHELVAALGDEHVDGGHALLTPCDQPKRFARAAADLAQRHAPPRLACRDAERPRGPFRARQRGD